MPAYSRATACSPEGSPHRNCSLASLLAFSGRPSWALMIGSRTRTGLLAAAREYAGFSGCVVGVPRARGLALGYTLSAREYAGWYLGLVPRA